MNLSNPTNLLIAGIYYTLTAILTFFSFFGVYILIRYGRSQSFGLTVALVYSFLFLKILAESHQTLQGLLT